MEQKAYDEVKTFVQACIEILCNQKAVDNLQALIDNCTEKEVSRIKTKAMNKVYKQKKRTGREMCMTMQIGEYEMDQFILDLGSDENFLPKKTQKNMGEPNLEWSTIQLCMANQQNTIPLEAFHRFWQTFLE